MVREFCVQNYYFCLSVYNWLYCFIGLNVISGTYKSVSGHQNRCSKIPEIRIKYKIKNLQKTNNFGGFSFNERFKINREQLQKHLPILPKWLVFVGKLVLQVVKLLFLKIGVKEDFLLQPV